MPEDEMTEQQSAPQQDAQPSAQPQQEQPQPEEETADAEEEKPKKNLTIPLLSALILLCLIAEVALASYIGLTLYQNVQNRRIQTAQYEAFLAQQSQLAQNPPRVQYIGPTVRVVDGVLVDNAAAAQAARAQAEGNIPGI